MMNFKDAKGREWEVNLNISSSRPLSRYLKELNPPVDLFNPPQFYAYISDITKAVDVLAILCAKQRDERGVSEEEFGEALWGGTAYEAQRVLNEEYLNFYPDPEVSKILRNTLQRLNESSQREELLIERFLGQVADNYKQRVEQLEMTLTSSSQNSQGGEESVPTTEI